MVRYAVVLANNDYYALIHKIQNQEAKFIKRHSNRVTEFLINYNKHCFRVICDKRRKTIITFLPL